MITHKTINRLRGQSMVEFALALPILFAALFGLLEVGRAVFMYSAVTNASREAVRYATAYGMNESGVLNYTNCAGIRETAKRVAFLVPLSDEDISIKYDTGPDPVTGITPAPFAECAPDEDVDNTIVLACGDRVVVDVSLHYAPIVPFVPQLTSKEFTSSSARTYTGIIELTDDPAECK